MRHVLLVILLCSTFADGIDAQVATPERLATRKKRLELHNAAMVDWHRRELKVTVDQTKRLAELLDKLVEADQNRWQARAYPDYGWFDFAGRSARGARGLIDHADWAAGRDAILTNDQQRRLDGILQDRRRFLEDHAAKGAMCAFELRVPLGDEHRAGLAALLHRRRSGLLSRPFPFAYEGDVRGALKDPEVAPILGHERMRVLTRPRIVAFRPRVVVRCELGDTEEERTRKLTDAVAGALDALELRMERTIGKLGEEFGLSEDQKNVMKTAAKGIRKRVGDRWVVQLRTSFERMGGGIRERRPGIVNTPMTLSTPLSATFQEEPLWVGALNRIVLGRAPDRQAARRSLVSQMIVALDQELWLRQDQRARMLRIIDPVISEPHNVQGRLLGNHALKHLLSGADQAAVRDLLSPEQLKVWQSLPGIPGVLQSERRLTELGGLAPRRGP